MTPRRPSARHMAMLKGAAWIVPPAERAEWIAEWSAELWYVNGGATAFCLGAFRDALWIRRNQARARRMFDLESPMRCLLLLAVLAGAASYFAWRLPAAHGTRDLGRFALSYLFIIVTSLLVLSATTSLALGEYPANRHAPAGAMRQRRWIFFAVKIALLVPIVWCGSLDLAAICAKHFAPHGFMLGLILGFRWALVDQRARCPVCLRRLTNPTRIGGASHAFLEWYGTELICARGHGLLYVPEFATSCYSTQRWQYLDPSWTGLFL